MEAEVTARQKLAGLLGGDRDEPQLLGTALLDRLKDCTLREWYLRAAAEYG